MDFELAFLGILAILAVVAAVLNARRGERPWGVVFVVFFVTKMVDLVRPEFRPVGSIVVLLCAVALLIMVVGKLLKKW